MLIGTVVFVFLFLFVLNTLNMYLLRIDISKLVDILENRVKYPTSVKIEKDFDL